MADIFISYAREDRERAHEIADALEARGWNVWWDREMLGGTSFDAVIEQELRAARCVIVLWSTAASKSRWVRNEARDAAERGVLVPVWIDDSPLPIAFSDLHAINLAEWSGGTTTPELEDLMRSIAPRIARPGGPQSATPPRVERRKTWIAALVMIAIVGTIVWIASNQRPSTRYTSKPVGNDMTSADASPVNASPTNANPTNANPANAVPQAVEREVRLWRNQSDESVNVYSSFDRNEPIALAGQNFGLSIRCDAEVLCQRVTVLLGGVSQPMVLSYEESRVTIPAHAVGADGAQLLVVYENLVATSLSLRR